MSEKEIVPKEEAVVLKARPKGKPTPRPAKADYYINLFQGGK